MTTMTRILFVTLFALALPAASAAASADHEVILGNYESARAALAKDDASAVPPLAAKIAMAASRALETREVREKEEIELILAGSRRLEEARGNLQASRAAFAALSRGVVALLAARPELAEGRFHYSCPMVKGYGQWVQAKKEIENPYKGSAMLRCAVPVGASR